MLFRSPITIWTLLPAASWSFSARCSGFAAPRSNSTRTDLADWFRTAPTLGLQQGSKANAGGALHPGRRRSGARRRHQVNVERRYIEEDPIVGDERNAEVESRGCDPPVGFVDLVRKAMS